MDPIIDGTVIDLLTGAPEGRTWLVLIGAILVATVAVLRFVAEGRLSETVGRWISALSAVVAAVGVAYMAGIDVWWHGLILGVIASPASRGLLLMVRDLLPGRDR